MKVIRHGDPESADRWLFWSNMTRFLESSEAISQGNPLPPDVSEEKTEEFARAIENVTAGTISDTVIDVFGDTPRPAVRCSECDCYTATAVEFGESHWAKQAFCPACVQKAAAIVGQHACGKVEDIARPDGDGKSPDQSGDHDGTFMMSL